MYEDLFKRINYRFKNLDLLKEALTHPSMSQSNKDERNYERLEFLGDAVLALVITELLIKAFEHDPEGDLAKRRAYLVSGLVLHDIALKLDIAKEIYMSEGEEKCGGRTSPHILENVMEALIGAIYLDSGLASSVNFVKDHWQHAIEQAEHPPVDSKTYLQEWAQAHGLGMPTYETINKTGSEHIPLFTTQVSVKNLPPFHASANSKKLAEKKAAQLMIDYIKNDPKN